MKTIGISEAERESKKLSPEHLSEAVHAVKVDEFVVLENAVEREHAEILCKKMLEDTERILARKDVPFNFNRANIQQDPPPFPPFLFKDLAQRPGDIDNQGHIGPRVEKHFLQRKYSPPQYL